MRFGGQVARASNEDVVSDESEGVCIAECVKKVGGGGVCSFFKVTVKRKRIVLIENDVFPMVSFSFCGVKDGRHTGAHRGARGDRGDGVCSGQRRWGDSHSSALFDVFKQGVVTLL